MIDLLFTIVTFLIPKAGVEVGSIPITLSLILFGVVLCSHPLDTLRSISRTLGTPWLYACFVVLSLIALLQFAVSGEGLYALSRIVVIMASPLAVAPMWRMREVTFMKICVIVSILLAIYGLMQFFLGVLAVDIPGVTSTLGQDLSRKMIGFNSVTGTAQKVPVTYQNGNAYGLFAALAASYLLQIRSDEQPWPRLRVIGGLAAVLGVILCGSRSIQIPFFALTPILIASIAQTRRPDQRLWTFIVTLVTACLGIVILATQESLIMHVWDRLVTQTVNDPTASGRTLQWTSLWEDAKYLSDLSLVVAIFVGLGEFRAEGAPSLIASIGFIPTVLFFILLVVAFTKIVRMSGHRMVSIGIAVAIFLFAVDTAFYYPPSMMIVYMFVGMCMSGERRGTSDVTGSQPRLNVRRT